LGIVTRFDLAAYPLPTVWAGLQFFNINESSSIVENIPDAISYLSDHNDEAGVMFFTFNETTPDEFVVLEAYYKDGEPFPPLWQTLVGDASNATYDSMGTKPFPQFLEEIAQISSAQKTIWMTFDFLPDGEFILDVWSKGKELHAALSEEKDIPGKTFDMSTQPMLKNMRCGTNAGPACDGAEEDLMSTYEHLD
jgi:hypothetical protein